MKPVYRYVLFAVLAVVFGLIAYDLGVRGAHSYERMLKQRAGNGLAALGIDWARLEADGLQLELHGHAPDMFARELAIETTQATVPIARVTSYATATLAPPEHREPVRVELLRDTRGITLTGQTASRTMRTQLNAALRRDGSDLTVHDLTGIQAATPPAGWGPEITVSSLAASSLPNAYVVMEPGRVIVEGDVENEEARERLTNALLERGGGRIAIVLRLDLPAEVVVPFAFSAYKDAGGGIWLERCVARSAEEQALLRESLRRVGMQVEQRACPVGLGGPGGDWIKAINAGLASLAALPAGRFDLEYRAARLTALPPSTPADFDAIETAFRTSLPEGFEGQGHLRAEDVATLTGIGRERHWLRLHRGKDGVILTGQVSTDDSKSTIETYAAALYGGAEVRTGLTVTGKPPPAGWQTTAISMLDHLQQVSSGSVEMAGFSLRFEGVTDTAEHARDLHRSIVANVQEYEVSTKLGVDLPGRFARIPLPGARCADELGRLIHDKPVDFDTGSAVITADTAGVLKELAAVLSRCADDPIEIGGHTDSQGSEDLNVRISQARAESVRTALIERGVPMAKLRARGYGESEPIADNATEEGRARNRRIEFRPAETSPDEVE